jgi:hypothetical protein
MTTLLEKPAPTQPPARPRGRALAWVAGTVGAVLLISGAVSLLSLALFLDEDRATSTTNYTYEARPTVELVADGSVTVTSGGTDVLVTALARSALSSATYSAHETGDRLTVTHRCFWYGSCSASLEVVVPAGTDVVVRGRDGDVRASSLVGGLDVHAGDGRVSVSDLDGSVRISASDGDVEVRGITGEVDLTARDGDVEVGGVDGSLTLESSDGSVRVEDVAQNVDVTSSDGDVDIYGTGRPVALEIQTSDGREVVDAPTDPFAAIHVRVTAQDGDVRYLGPRS